MYSQRLFGLCEGKRQSQSNTFHTTDIEQTVCSMQHTQPLRKGNWLSRK
jgi:hypothetical protein